MQLKNIIVFMGPPGSGKGTQTKLLVEKLHYAFLGMGDTLREYARQDTPLGREIKATIDQGIIIPDHMTNRIFREKFETILDYMGVVLDGYPRTMSQMEELKEAIQKYNIPSFKVIFLEVDKSKLLERLTLRSKSEGRADDAEPQLVEKRFDEYIAKTAPVKSIYETEGVLIHINGDQPIEAVHEEIMKSLS